MSGSTYSLTDRFAGSMLGLALGDAMGTGWVPATRARRSTG